MQWLHMLLHLPMRDDDFLNYIHNAQRLCRGCGVPLAILCERRYTYNETHSLDSPSDTHGIRPSDSLRQKAYYEQRVASSLSEALSAPILSEKPVHRQCLHGRDHEPANTNSYSSSVLVE